MGGQSKGQEQQTQTQTTRPPDYAIPYFGSGLQNANLLLQKGGPKQYQGSTVTPFSGQTNTALNLQQQRAMGGSPVTGSAQDLITATLRGDYLNSNPYLDKTFDRAAGAVGRQLDTTFARSGRDLDSNMGVRTDALNNLATDIYGGNYQAERGMQMGAVNSAIPLAREDYFDIGQLRGVGAEVENLAGQYQQDAQSRFDYEQQRPEAALDAYLQRLSGNFGSANTSPIYRNRSAGALGGAASGASMGSTFGPWGAAIGGIAGGLLGSRQ